MHIAKSVEASTYRQLCLFYGRSFPYLFLSVTCNAAALLASDTIRWTVRRTRARLKAPMVRCIVRSVCTCCSCRLAISFLVVFVAVHGTSRAAEALRVMLKCDRASSRGKCVCHASILPAPATRYTRSEKVSLVTSSG
jgi:hypothetical protein